MMINEKGGCYRSHYPQNVQNLDSELQKIQIIEKVSPLVIFD